jgi:hypothetical protein
MRLGYSTQSTGDDKARHCLERWSMRSSPFLYTPLAPRGENA